MQPILVPGGTGRLGSLVVAQLRDAGYPVRALSRRRHEAAEGVEYVTGDLATGEGIEAAVKGTEIIVFCAGSFNGDKRQIVNLVRAASEVGTRRLVYISVVGADRIPVESLVDRAMFTYFASKLAGERAVAESGLSSWATLRATQFYDALLLVARQMARLPVIPTPSGFRFQPIDSGEVAARLVELALDETTGLAPDMAGPRIYGMDELIQAYLRASYQRRPFVPIWLPGKAARAVRAGAILAPDRAVGQRTWEEFLADQVSSSSNSASGLP